MYDLQDQKFYVRCELEKINEDIRTLKNNIKQSNREYEKQWLKCRLRECVDISNNLIDACYEMILKLNELNKI